MPKEQSEFMRPGSGPETSSPIQWAHRKVLEMKTWKSLILIAVVACATSAFAQPAIGVFFDEAGTINHATPNGGLGEIHTAYVCAVNCEMMVAGASFKLVMDPQILLLTATYPEGLAVGEIAAGVDLGLTNPIAAFFGDAAVLATLQLTTFNNLMDHAPMTISNHPSYATPKVADSLANLYTATGLVSHLSIVVGNETKSWSEVKSLFQ